MHEDNEKIFARITTSPLSADSAYQFCLSPENGAVDIFIGTVRNEFGGRPVEQIDYQAYPDMAEKILRTILQSACGQWPLNKVYAVHRIGLLKVTEASIVVAVGAGHRGEAFEACRWIMEAIKRDLPVWKKEFFADGSVEWQHAGAAAISKK